MEVEFEVSDSAYFLNGLSEACNCRVQLEQLVPRPDNTYTLYDSITGARPADIRTYTQTYADIETRVISQYGDAGVYEFQVADEPTEYFSVTLAAANAIPRDIWSFEGVAHIVADIPPSDCAADVINHFRTVHPTATLGAQRQTDRVNPLFSQHGFQSALSEVLTPRQREVLVVAHAGGYFAWPREKTAEELADGLDISAPTFAQHLRIAQRKLVSLAFTTPTSEP